MRQHGNSRIIPLEPIRTWQQVTAEINQTMDRRLTRSAIVLAGNKAARKLIDSLKNDQQIIALMARPAEGGIG